MIVYLVFLYYLDLKLFYLVRLSLNTVQPAASASEVMTAWRYKVDYYY